jgi:hypothetical protein
MAARTITGNLKVYPVDIAAGTSTEDLIPAVPGKVIRIEAASLIISAASEVCLLSNATPISAPQDLPTSMAWNMNGEFEYETDPGEALRISRSTAVRITGDIKYREIG